MTVKIQEEAQSIVDYAMRKGGETIFSDNEHYPIEWQIIGDFLTGFWIIRGEYTKENPPYCYQEMNKPLLGTYNRVAAIEKVAELLKTGAIVV